MIAQSNLLVRNRDFRLVWIGQVLSQAGSRAYFINLLWWIVTTMSPESGDGQRSAWASGFLLIIMGLPSVLFLSWIGRVLARRASKDILVGFECLGALFSLVVFGLAVSGGLTLPLIYGLSALIALCQAFVDPTLIKAVPELVDPVDVEEAVGFESSTQALAFFSGAALGAVASGTLGFSVTIALNTISYALSAWMTSRANFRTSIDLKSSSSPEAALSKEAKKDSNKDSNFGLDDSAGKGLSPEVGPLLLAFGLANVFIFPLFLILPLFVKQSFEGSILMLGFYEACFWLGLIIGASQAWRLRVTGSFLKLSALLFLIFGALICSIPLNSSSVWVGLVLMCGGISAGLVNVKIVTYFQSAVPEAGRGAFFAKLQAFVAGAQPLSYLIFTGVLMVVSPLHTFAISGLGLACIGAICWWYDRRLSAGVIGVAGAKQVRFIR